MTQIGLGLFSLTLHYLHKPKGRHTWYYRRQVPADLRRHYSQPALLKSLKTRDKTQAARSCLKLNDQVEKEFDRLRRGLPKRRSSSLHQKAIQMLYEYDIAPEIEMDDGARTALEGKFLDHLEDKLSDKLSKEEFEHVWYKEGDPSAHLDVVEAVALEILRGRYRPLASAFPNSYVHLKHRENDKKFTDAAERAITFLLEFLPDKSPGEYTRAEVRLLIKSHLDKGGMKTATLHRQLTVLRAMFNKVSLELELKEDSLHPFSDFEVPGLREDSDQREDFERDQLDRLRESIKGRKPEIEQLIHLMLETGLRVNECCGLLVSDIQFAVDVPHLVIHRNAFRRLKTKNSQRFIPLVGVALKAMKQAVKDKGQGDWVFPSYINAEKEETRNTSASAAVNKRIKSILGEDAPTCHSFRHTFNTRLRNVDCPRDIRDELGGWAKTISDKYGTPTDLKIKARYITKSIKN